MMNLSDEQKKAVEKLEKLRVGALFMEPGTGKTLTTLKLIESSKADYVLFLVPFRTKDNLKKELKKWNFKHKNLEIQGIESLSNSSRLYIELLNKVKESEKAFVIVDESLKIKNSDALRTQRILMIGKYAYYKLILNGTPISRCVQDLYTQMNFLSPKILGMSFQEFKYTFLKFVEVKTNGKSKEIVLENTNIDYLYSLIKPYIFESKLMLDINENQIELDYEIENKHDYFECKQKFLDSFDALDNSSFFKYTTLMQMSYCVDKNKMSLLKGMLKTLSDKTIVFCRYIKSKNAIEELINKNNIDAICLTYQKGSLGLNLQDYSNIIFFDKVWDYALIEQAKRRIFRIGQKKDVKYYFLTGDVGLENMFNISINKKVTLLNMFKNATKEELQREL